MFTKFSHNTGSYLANKSTSSRKFPLFSIELMSSSWLLSRWPLNAKFCFAKNLIISSTVRIFYHFFLISLSIFCFYRLSKVAPCPILMSNSCHWENDRMCSRLNSCWLILRLNFLYLLKPFSVLKFDLKRSSNSSQ